MKNFSARQVGVLLESMNKKLDLLVDGQAALSVRIDRLEVKFDELQKEMNYKFETVFEELHLIREALKEKVSRQEFGLLEKRVVALEKRLEREK